LQKTAADSGWTCDAGLAKVALQNHSQVRFHQPH
jgi:hypothetical protein